jgi:hypothetical protein
LSLVALLAGCDNDGRRHWIKDTSSAELHPQGFHIHASAQQDLVDVSSRRIASGPVISGSLQAEKQADLRAEVSAIVMQVLKDDGDAVEKGICSCDSTIPRFASLNSAQKRSRSPNRVLIGRTALAAPDLSVPEQCPSRRKDAELRRHRAKRIGRRTHARGTGVNNAPLKFALHLPE